MLMNLLLRPALGLISLLTLSVVLIRAQPYDDGSLHDLLAQSEECPALCPLGIRPGRTTVGEALDRLQANDWITDARLIASGAGYGDIRWSWSGQQPGLIDDSRPGRATFYWDSDESYGMELRDARIETVTVHTRIRMYLLQAWFGLPDNGGATFRLDEGLGYSSTYKVSYGVIDVSTVLPCPANLLSFWDARGKITLSIGHSTGAFVPPVDMVKMC